MVQISGEFVAKIPDFRKIFFNEVDTAAVDVRDLDRLRSDDQLAFNFLKHQNGDISAAITMAEGALRMRKDLEVNDLTEKSFPLEMLCKGFCYYHNEDKDGHRILFFHMCRNKKESLNLRLKKQFLFFWLEKHYKERPDESIVAFMDMTDAGFYHIDMDLLKFQIACFTAYYPCLLEYMLIFEMPWVLNAVWKVIKSLLSSEQQKRVIFSKKSDVKKYIEKDQLFEYMGGTDSFEYLYIPAEDSGIDDAAEEDESDRTSEGVDTVEGADGKDTGESVEGSRECSFTSDELTLERTAVIENLVMEEMEKEPFEAIKKKSVTIDETRNATFQAALEPASGDSVGKKDASRVALKKNDRTRLRYPPSSFIADELAIHPAEDLMFTVTDPKKDTQKTLRLFNRSSMSLAYKVKTTSPDKFRVQKSSGVIAEAGSAEVIVILVAGHSHVETEKFLVMYKTCERNFQPSQVGPLFKSADRAGINEHRLRCCMGRPPSKEEQLLTRLHEEVGKLHRQVEKLQVLQQSTQSSVSIGLQMQFLMCIFFLLLVFLGVYLLYTQQWPVSGYCLKAPLPLAQQ